MKKASLALLVIIILASVLLLTVALYIGLTYAPLTAMPSISLVVPPEQPEAPLVISQTKGKWTVLLVGLDIEDMDSPTSLVRTDVLMIATVKECGQVNLLSIPRDTYVDIPTYGYSKINHAFSYGGGTRHDTGIWLTLQTVKKLLEIEIDNYAIFDLQSIPRLVDRLGGVWVEGTGELNGPEALAFARWRGDGLGDIGRIPRQHRLLQAVFNKALSLATETSKFTALVNFLLEQVRTDINLGQALDRAKTMYEPVNYTVNFYIVPGRAVMKNGISYWEPNIQELRSLLEIWGGE